MTDPPNNPLPVQRAFFELALQADPSDVTVRFALAQTLKESGEESAANAAYDEGIAHANRVWFPKLFLFTAVTGAGAAGMWALGLRWPWLLAIVVALGPLQWWLIRRNRQFYLPQVGFMQRAEAIQTIDMAAEISQARQEGEEA